MSKGLALLPMLLLIVPGVFIGTQLTARNFGLYYPLIAILMVAMIINIFMMVWHRKKEHQIQK